MISTVLRTAVFAIVLILTSTAQIFAQGAYLKLGGRYNFALGYMSASEYSTSVSSIRNFKVEYNQVKMNYGRGFSFEGGAGYMFNKNIGAELNISYLKSKSIELATTEYYPEYLFTYFHNYETYAKTLIINPSLVVSGSNETIIPYGRLGFLLAKATIYNTETRTLMTDKIIAEREQTGNWALGFQACGGVNFKASDKVIFFTELTFNYLHIAPEKEETLSLMDNGHNTTHTLSMHDKQTDYVESLTETYDSEGKLITDSSKPTQVFKQELPFSSIGLGLGVKYNF